MEFWFEVMDEGGVMVWCLVVFVVVFDMSGLMMGEKIVEVCCVVHVLVELM